MIRRFVPIMMIAFVVGSLFRLYEVTGVGFYRMFGTLGIVVLGVMASRLIVTAQLEEGERQLREAIAALPDDCDIWRLSERGADRIVVGPGGTAVLVVSHVAQYARGWGLQRSLTLARQRVERAVRAAQRALESASESKEGPGGERTKGNARGQMRPAVVFLRRLPGAAEREFLARAGITALIPEEVADFLQAVALGEPGRFRFEDGVTTVEDDAEQGERVPPGEDARDVNGNDDGGRRMNDEEEPAEQLQL